MEADLVGAASSRRPRAADDEPASESTGHHERVVRAYLAGLLGPDRGRALADRALADLAVGAGASPPDAASVRVAAQTAGFAGLDAETRRFARRVLRAATGRRQCNAVARRLRGRASGQISADGLDAFYRHLERCHTCATVASRFDASEWYLQVELGSAKAKPVPDPALAPPKGRPEPKPASIGTDAAVATDADAAVATDARADAPVGAMRRPAPTAPGLPDQAHVAARRRDPMPALQLAATRFPDPALTPLRPAATRRPDPAPARSQPAPKPPSDPGATLAAEPPPDSRPTPQPPGPPLELWPDRVLMPAAREADPPGSVPTPTVPAAVPAPVERLAAAEDPVASRPSPATRPKGFDPAPGFRDHGKPGSRPSAGTDPQPAALLQSSTRRRSHRRSGVVALAMTVVLAAAAAAAVIMTGATNGPSTAPGFIRPLQETTTNGPATPAAAIHLYTTRTPFEVARIRFAVLVNAHQTWTGFTRRVSPGTGDRWVLVTLLARNIGRPGFDPRVLHYRLLGGDGVNYFPNLAYGTGGRVHLPANPVPIGALAQAELAFRVPASAAGLQLAFDPTGKHHRVVVGLGQ